MPKPVLVTRRLCLETLTAVGAQLLVGGCDDPPKPPSETVPPTGEPGPDAAAKPDVPPVAADAEPSKPETPSTPEAPSQPDTAPSPPEPASEAAAPAEAEAPAPEPAAPAVIKKVVQPHVLFISIDDMNDWVGVLGGNPQARTPNIDALAKSGMLFANAHCAAPSCNGSRAATMTGLRPSSTGVYANSHPWRQHLPDAVTIPDHFKRNGYRAIGAGKMFHGPFPDPGAWNDYFPSLCRQTPKDREEIKRGKQTGKSGIPKMGNFDWGPLDKPNADMSDAKVVDWVIKNLPGADAKPTFLACGLYRPHLPWYVPQEWFDLFPLSGCKLPKVLQDDRKDIPKAALKNLKYDKDHKRIVKADQWQHAVQAYLASCAFADAMVGRPIDALRESPAADNTVVVLWSDHGWHLGEKLKWRKFTLWEEATRVPLIITGPSVPNPGVCTRAVSLLDIYPTLTEICGLPPNEAVEGRSLAKLLADPQAEKKRSAITTWGRGNHSIRTERWRYTRYKKGAEELYDHEADPNEWTNLAGDEEHAKVIKRLAARLPGKSVKPAPKRKDYAKKAFECDPDELAEDDGDEDVEDTDDE